MKWQDVKAFLKRQYILWNGRKMKNLLYPVVIWLALLVMLSCTRVFGQNIFATYGSAYVNADVDGADIDVAWDVPGPMSAGHYYVAQFYLSSDGGATNTNWIYNGYFSHNSATATHSIGTYTHWRVWVGDLENGTNADLGHIDTGWQPIADEEEPYRVRSTGTNNSDQEIRVGMVDNNGDTIFDIIVQPGESWDETHEVDEADGPFTPVIATRNEFSDGVWLAVDLEDADPTPAGPAVPPSQEDPIPGESTVVQNITNQTVNNVNINNNPSPNSPSNNDSTPWVNPTPATVDNERLDKATYKQGVDKIETAIKQGTKDVVKEVKKQGEDTVEAIESLLDATAPSIGDVAAGPLPDPVDPLPSPNVVAGEGAIPEVPDFFTGTLSAETTITAELDMFGDTYDWTLDLTDYDEPIEIVRGVLTTILFVMFFLLLVRTARGAVAG